ncbi:hypothetical protein PUN28_003769 [Cardiocondyla obscurior]|uniref:Uncharacterized protein n=1 Tax=Cardiocondyla obscurior TaxID=286306 RepID=A0AAW2GLN6_9HYME
MLLTSRASTTAPHNSKRGKVMVLLFTGATRDLAHSNLATALPLVSIAWTYAQAP